MNKHFTLTLVAILFLSACNTSNVRLRVEDLDESIKQYNIAWRWAMYNRIEAYHRSTSGQPAQLEEAALENVRVTGYTVKEKNINPEYDEATVKGEIDYYHTNQGTLQKLSFDHRWWYDPELKAWFNSSPIPDFK